MNKAIGLALLAAGIAMIVFGAHSSDSVSSHLSRTFNGTPTDQTMWLLIGGIASAIVGAAVIFAGSWKIHK